MNRSLKIIVLGVAIVLIIAVISSFFSSTKKEEKNKFKIVTTTFSSYDFVRQIVKDKADVEFLLGPGIDAHSYEPSASDLIKIQSADMFIYVGGEMEKWSDKVINSDTLNVEKTKLVKISDAVETIEEQEIDGAEEEEEVEGAFDEHIWTSPTNAIKMLKYLNTEITKLDEENKDFYQANTDSYENEIVDLRNEIQKIIDDKVRNRLVFGDKMPMQYFLNEFGLTASAAFSGCSTETEPSSKTIAYLISKIKEENIPVILYIEMSTGKVAKTISEETGAEAMQIQTLHNISKTDFENGENYITLMTRNLEVLRKALK